MEMRKRLHGLQVSHQVLVNAIRILSLIRCSSHHLFASHFLYAYQSLRYAVPLAGMVCLLASLQSFLFSGLYLLCFSLIGQTDTNARTKRVMMPMHIVIQSIL